MPKVNGEARPACLHVLMDILRGGPGHPTASPGGSCCSVAQTMRRQFVIAKIYLR